ncbi:MAG: porin family protein [Deltaproteobacteria bacterium]|nr:porin family protein [Deltaproteobacteria bacterium]
MKRMLITLIGLLVAAATPAIAADPDTSLADRTPLMYASIDAGVSIVPDRDVRFFRLPSTLENDTGWTVGAEIGSQATEHLRFGLSVLYNRFKTSSVQIWPNPNPKSGGQVDMVRPIWNFYYDFSFLDEFLRPYVGVGLGAVWAQFDSTSLGYGETSDWGLAFVAHAGTHIALTDMWLLKVGYRYNTTGSLWNDQENFIFGNISSHDFIAGVRMDF